MDICTWQSVSRPMAVTQTNWKFERNLPPRKIFECLHATFQRRACRISYEVISACSDYISSRSKHKPKIGIICGSGLGSPCPPPHQHLTRPLHRRPRHPRQECRHLPLLGDPRLPAVHRGRTRRQVPRRVLQMRPVPMDSFSNS